MKLYISDLATQWFIEELNLKPGQGVRFIGKVYGKTAVHEGMSLGITKTLEIPTNVEAEVLVNERYFWVSKHDAWFFGEYDLDIDFDPVLAEPKYNFILDGKIISDQTSGASATDGTSGASQHDEP